MTQIWDSGNSSAAWTISGSPAITATINTATNGNYSVRALNGITSGKYYWEVPYTWTSANGTGSNGVGIVNENFTFTTSTHYIGFDTNSLGYYTDSNVYNNGASLSTLALWTTGTPVTVLICVCVDLSNNFIWFRIGTSGNWNNNASNNPSTPSGGIAIPLALYSGHTIYPAVTGLNNVAPDTAVGHFASGNIQGAVPSGFVLFDGDVLMAQICM